MRQAVMYEPGVISITHADVPDIGSDELLIRTERIGICGSDVHVFDGHHPYTTYPVVQGHEVSGTVAAVGDDVEEFSVGDAITFAPQVTCGRCHACRSGSYHICEELKVMGFQTGGAAQDFFAVRAANALALGPHMTLDQGALVEPAAVAHHALMRGAPIHGDVLVLGAGPIGNLVAQEAKILGATSTMITDVSDYRLEKALACGIDFAVNAERDDLGDAIRRHFMPDGPDLVLECVGSQDTADQAIAHARKGATIVVVGVYGAKPVVDLGLVQDRELTLRGTLMYRKDDFAAAIDLIESGQLELDSLITHRFALEEYTDAYRLFKSGGDHLKVLVDLT